MKWQPIFIVYVLVAALGQLAQAQLQPNTVFEDGFVAGIEAVAALPQRPHVVNEELGALGYGISHAAGLWLGYQRSNRAGLGVRISSGLYGTRTVYDHLSALELGTAGGTTQPGRTHTILRGFGLSAKHSLHLTYQLPARQTPLRLFAGPELVHTLLVNKWNQRAVALGYPSTAKGGQGRNGLQLAAGLGKAFGARHALLAELYYARSLNQFAAFTDAVGLKLSDSLRGKNRVSCPTF